MGVWDEGSESSEEGEEAASAPVQEEEGGCTQAVSVSCHRNSWGWDLPLDVGLRPGRWAPWSERQAAHRGSPRGFHVPGTCLGCGFNARPRMGLEQEATGGWVSRIDASLSLPIPAYLPPSLKILEEIPEVRINNKKKHTTKSV